MVAIARSEPRYIQHVNIVYFCTYLLMLAIQGLKVVNVYLESEV